MKQLITLCLVMAPFFSFAQTNSDSTAFQPTTMEEYNYITKSYEDVLKSGADIKRGYHVETLYKLGSSVKDIELRGLYNDTVAKRKATIIVFYNKGNPVKVICMPNLGSETSLFNKYSEDVYMLGAVKSVNLTVVLSRFYLDHITK